MQSDQSSLFVYRSFDSMDQITSPDQCVCAGLGGSAGFARLVIRRCESCGGGGGEGGGVT